MVLKLMCLWGPDSLTGECPPACCRSVVLKVWSLNQQQHHLGTCKTSKFPDPTRPPESETLVVTTSNLGLQAPLMQLDIENHCSRPGILNVMCTGIDLNLTPFLKLSSGSSRFSWHGPSSLAAVPHLCLHISFLRTLYSLPSVPWGLS